MGRRAKPARTMLVALELVRVPSEVSHLEEGKKGVWLGTVRARSQGRWEERSVGSVGHL